MIWLHKIARAYSKRPSEIIGMDRNPNIAIMIDALVFDVGYTTEQKEEAEIEKAKIKYYNDVVKLLITARR